MSWPSGIPDAPAVPQPPGFRFRYRAADTVPKKLSRPARGHSRTRVSTPLNERPPGRCKLRRLGAKRP